MNARALLILTVVTSAALAYSRRASGAVNPSPSGWFDPREYLPYNPVASPQTVNPGLWTNDPFAYTEPAAEFDPANWTRDPFEYAEIPAMDTTTTYDETGAVVPIVNTTSRAQEYMKNLQAFLSVIRNVEPDSPHNYASLVGGGSITDFSDHPANLGWPGTRRTDGRKTTAAGAYQITGTTWNTLKQRGTPLPDFSPASQDIAAVAITQLPWRQNAYADILAGNFDLAVRKLTNEWEAFSRILAGNYHYTLPQIKSIYTSAGGKITGETFA